jgi:hypothetical protein
LDWGKAEEKLAVCLDGMIGVKAEEFPAGEKELGMETDELVAIEWNYWVRRLGYRVLVPKRRQRERPEQECLLRYLEKLVRSP